MIPEIIYNHIIKQIKKLCLECEIQYDVSRHEMYQCYFNTESTVCDKITILNTMHFLVKKLGILRKL
jgi:hypothetical protein